MKQEQLTEILENHALWIRGKGGRMADLSGADINRANLCGANLSAADMRGANMIGANMRGAKLIGADLSGANLSKADLSGANLIAADMRWANMSVANLSNADLRWTDINRADLSGANLIGANLYMTVGIRHAHCGWHGHGEYGSQLLAVEIAGEVRIFCEYFEGTTEELDKYIEAGTEKHKASRREAMAFVLSCFDNHQMYKDCANEP